MKALAKVESWEDHLEAWHHFGRVVDGAAWGRAAVASSLKCRYGDGSIEKFAKEVGQSPSAVWRLVQVQEAFPENSRRRENLSFSHHIEAVTAPDPHAALAKAEAEGWSVREMRGQLRTEKPEFGAPTKPKLEPLTYMGLDLHDAIDRALATGHAFEAVRALYSAWPKDISMAEPIAECRAVLAMWTAREAA